MILQKLFDCNLELSYIAVILQELWCTRSAWCVQGICTILTVCRPLALGILCYIPIAWSSTWIRYRVAVKNFTAVASSTNRLKPPPILPYKLPWLGSSLWFHTTAHGRFWRWLEEWRKDAGVDVFMLLLGGQNAYMLMSRKTVTGMLISTIYHTALRAKL
jgi:hypothetical protein